MSTFRTNITIPTDLKARMDQVPFRINWSRVAAEAFEEVLAAIKYDIYEPPPNSRYEAVLSMLKELERRVIVLEQRK